FCVALGFQEQLMRLFMRPFRLAIAELTSSELADWKKQEHAAPATPIDAVVDELEKNQALPPDSIKVLRDAQQREREREWEQTAPKYPSDLQAVRLGEPFSAYMEICTLVAALVAAPLMLQQLWAFVSAGLYENEKRTVRRVLPWSLILFFLGIV